MLHLRYLTHIFLLALPVVGFAAEYIYPEIVDLSVEDREELVAAPEKVMNTPPTVELSEAIQVGAIKNLKVEKFSEEVPTEVAAQIKRNTVTTYQGWIRYAPVVLSDSREYQPIVLCVSQDEEVTWGHCQDESWTKVQTSAMGRPVRLDGKLSDKLVEEALLFVGQLGLVSQIDNSTITANSIHHMVAKAFDAGGIRLFSRTQVRGYWDTIEVSYDLDENGAATFHLKEFRSGP